MVMDWTTTTLLSLASSWAKVERIRMDVMQRRRDRDRGGREEETAPSRAVGQAATP
jgi:hypothetical protein